MMTWYFTWFWVNIEWAWMPIGLVVYVLANLADKIIARLEDH